jgi:hypothetical protein
MYPVVTPLLPLPEGEGNTKGRANARPILLVFRFSFWVSPYFNSTIRLVILFPSQTRR